MGQKVNPIGFRVGISRDWSSRWFAGKKDYADFALEDLEIRKILKKKFELAGIKSVDIERSLNEITILVKVSKPGMVIGKGGLLAEEAKDLLKKATKSKVSLNVEEVKVPEIEAQLVADYICRQLKRRLPYRRVASAAATSAMDRGAKGVRIRLAGLLSGGNSIARTEIVYKGSVPAQTLRADIDYARVHCLMLYGMIGVKVWIYKGELEI